MRDALVIRFEETAKGGRYIIVMPNGEQSRLTFVRAGEGHIIADHTFVPPPYRNQCVAESMVERLTPTPDIAFLLDVPPEQAYARKREQPFSYLERRWEAYKVVFPWIPTAVVLANENIHAAESGLYRTVHRSLVGT